MGRFARWIDGVVLGLIAYAAAFLFFFHTTGEPWAAAFMAAPLCALTAWGYRRLTKHRHQQRERMRQARAMVERLAFLPDEEARAQAFRCAGLDGVLLQRHPKGRPLDADEVLALWRDAKVDPLVIATTGPVSDGAWGAAESLSTPKVTVLDARMLAERYEKSGLPLDEIASAKRHISLRVPRKRAKHCAIYGCTMLGVYILTGMWSYLAASVTLLALMILALRRRAPSPG